MKFIYKALLLLLCLWMDACNQKQDGSMSNPTPIGGTNTGSLWLASVSANADGVAIVALDSASQDVLMVHGSTKSDGTLRPLSRITRLKKSGDFISVRFAENTFLPTEVVVTSKNESATIKLINVYQYDGTIDFDVTNNVTTKTGSVKAYKLPEQSFTKLVKAQESYSANFKSARTASATCTVFSAAGSILEAIECAFTIDPVPALTPVIGTSLDKVLIPLFIQDCKTALTIPVSNESCKEYSAIGWAGATGPCKDAVGSGGGVSTNECYTKIAQIIQH